MVHKNSRITNKKIMLITIAMVFALLIFSNISVKSEDTNTTDIQPDQETTQVDVLSETNNNLDASEINNKNPNIENSSSLESSPSENNPSAENIKEENNSLPSDMNVEINNSSIVYNLNETNNTPITLPTEEKLEDNENNKNIEKNISETNPVNLENNVSEDSNTSSTKTFDYLPIESFTPLNNGNTESLSLDSAYPVILDNSTGNETENLPIKMINITLSKDGKIELTGEAPENFDINSIEKEEKIINENWAKQVILKSKDHLDSSLEVYTDIPKINADRKDEVTIFWVNENKTLNPSSFYDTDQDGLIDRISWTVPHLSEQIFEISIDFQLDSYSPEISLGVISAPNGIAINPINFKFNISYQNLENLNCTLFIGNYFYPLVNLLNKTEFQFNLQNGNYNWYLRCEDGNLSEQTEVKIFIINESFSVNTEQKIYISGEPVIVNLNSNKNINATINIYSPKSAENKTFQVFVDSNSYAINLSNQDIADEGLYQVQAIYNALAEPYVVYSNFSIAKVLINLSNVTAKVGEEVKIYTNISSPAEKITSIIVDFGDGTSNVTYFNINENNKSIEFRHKYLQENNYTVKLSTIIGGRSFEIQKNSINISKNLSIDLERPIISLIYPDDGLILNTSSITFSYSASDNIKISNCTFELYNNTGILGILNYSKTEQNPNNLTKNITLSGMSEGYYSWIVECYDNSSNSQYASRSFRISFQSQQNNSASADISSASANSAIKNSFNYSKSKAYNLLSELKAFLAKQNSYNPDQKEAMDDLGISEDLDYYNKRLVQIDQDLSNNVNYIKDSLAREARVQELLNELENISQKIPSDIEVVDKSEFVKNSISNDFINILSNYLKSQNIALNNNQIKDLAEKNYNIQGYLSVSTKAKQVRIKYNSTEKEITLISKKIDIKNSSFDKILEIIPKEVSDSKNIVFINEDASSGDTIFEISPDNLIDNKTLYYMEGFIDLKKIEKTDTLLYKSFPIKNLGITGFSVLDLNSSIKNSLYYSIILFLIFGFLVFLAISKKVKIAIWKKDEKVIKIFNLIKDAKRNLNAKNIISAKEKYHEIKEIYPAIPSGCKKYLYKSIENIRTEIDKKDISNMIKEYYEVKKQGREDDARLIYENIKTSYKNLPKKYQLRVYEKLFKNLSEK